MDKSELHVGFQTPDGLRWEIPAEPQLVKTVQRPFRAPVVYYFLGLEIIDKGVLREHQDIYVDGNVVGHTTSGTFSPLLQVSIAQALIDKKYSELGQIVEVDVRGRRLKAKVVEMPFYKK